MDKLKSIKIKYQDGTYSDEIPIGVSIENVDYNDTKTLKQVLDLDITKGTVEERLNKQSNDISSMSTTVNNANENANVASTKADAVDTRLDNIIVESGTSDAETIAARTNTNTGITYTTLGQRLDAENSEIKEDLLQKAGLSDEAKQALLACFAKVAWIDEHGQAYYDALEDALYPPVELVRISCVYTQSKTVYYASSLNKLKSDLIVTAYMSDGTTRTITDYELSGTLTVGTSVITVTHGGKVATFSVTVTQPPYTWRYSASSGKLLSEESYFNNVNIDSTCTEELVNGVLELSAPPSAAPEPAVQYYLTPATNVHAAVKFKIKYIEIPEAVGTGGFRVILSDGSEGSRIGVRKDRSSGKYKLGIREGSTDIDILELELNTWYEMLLEKNGQNTIVTLDGTEVYNSNTPSTSSTTENRILNQSTNRGNSIVDIEYIEYYNYDYDTEE